jgi:hypothetical protein
MKTLLLLFLTLTAAAQSYTSDTVSVYIEESQEWLHCRTKPRASRIKFLKNKAVTFYDLDNELTLTYSNMTDLGEALQFDFINEESWLILTIQKDLSKYQTYTRNRDCTAIKKVFNISTTKWITKK